MKYYYKTSKGKVVELEQKSLYLYNNDIVELIIPDGCEYVHCYNNQLKELILPDGCEWVWADMKSVALLNKVDNLYLYI